MIIPTTPAVSEGTMRWHFYPAISLDIIMSIMIRLGCRGGSCGIAPQPLQRSPFGLKGKRIFPAFKVHSNFFVISSPTRGLGGFFILFLRLVLWVKREFY